MVSYIKGGMQANGARKQDPENSIWSQGDESMGWRRLHNEELNSMYLSANIVRVNKSRWAGHVARMEDKIYFNILTGKPTGTMPLGRHGVHGKTILEWTLNK
jgi:hypothetical protein